MWGWRETIFLHFLCFSISKFQQGYSHIAKMEELITEQISWTGPSIFCWTNDDERIKRWIHNQREQVRENKDTIFSKCNHHLIPCALLQLFSSITWSIEKMLLARYPMGSPEMRHNSWVCWKDYGCVRMRGLPKAPGTVMALTPLCGADLLGWVPSFLSVLTN